MPENTIDSIENLDEILNPDADTFSFSAVSDDDIISGSSQSEPVAPEHARLPNNYEDLKSLANRNADGSNNNAEYTDWGSAGVNVLRQSYADYQDGESIIPDRVNARHVSEEIVAQDHSITNSYGVSDMFTFFGQFIDHDIDISREGNAGHMELDYQGSQFGIERSTYAPGTGENGVAREHPNAITSFVDASNIYGSNETVTSLLRADSGTSAYMLTGHGGNLPTLSDVRANAGGTIPASADLFVSPPNVDTDSLFISGDVRVNENIALTSMHTIWMREHNHWVDKIKGENPDWSEQQYFDAAKTMVEMEIQKTVYEEYLPLLIGKNALPEYEGYASDVNPGIAHEFATAAFRLGHSQLSPVIKAVRENGDDDVDGGLPLSEIFFSPDIHASNSALNSIMRGLSDQKGQEIDVHIVDDVRNFLFGGTLEKPLDLATLNLMRAQDHGIPTMNEVREAYGMQALTSFSDLTSDASLAAKLQSVYGSIDKVDLWIGGLAEDKTDGSQLGSTFQSILVDQFTRIRDGDSYFYETRLQDNPELLAEIKDTSLSDVILRNTDIDYLQDDVLVYHQRVGGSDGRDTLRGSNEHDLILGFNGHDKLYGKNGDDDLYGGAGRDTLKGGNGNDILAGENGHDRLSGGQGDDDLDGGTGRDRLFGGNGNDVLDGGIGHDQLTGGRGDDIFVFSKYSGRDKVLDFARGNDKIDLREHDFHSFDDVLEASRSVNHGRSTVIDLNTEIGDRVQLVGVKLSQLSEHDFILDEDGTDLHIA